MIEIIHDKLKKDKLISRILLHFIKKDTLSEDEYRSLAGTKFKKETRNWNVAKGNLQQYEHSWLTNIQNSMNSSIIEKPGESSIIRITKPWKKLLLEVKKEDDPKKEDKKDKKEVEEEPEPAPAPEEPKFKKGDQVEWQEKGKQTTGTIDKIVTKDGKEIAEITTSDGKDITKAISNIKILE